MWLACSAPAHAQKPFEMQQLLDAVKLRLPANNHADRCAARESIDFRPIHPHTTPAFVPHSEIQRTGMMTLVDSSTMPYWAALSSPWASSSCMGAGWTLSDGACSPLPPPLSPGEGGHRNRLGLDNIGARYRKHDVADRDHGAASGWKRSQPTEEQMEQS